MRDSFTNKGTWFIGRQYLVGYDKFKGDVCI